MRHFSQRWPRPVKARLIVVVMALLPGIAIWQGCNKPPALAQRQAMIVISGDTHGWIVPCGCTANQSGGLLRRGAYLRQLRTDADVLYFDAGGAGAGTSPYQQAKLEAIFSGEMAMGISAHNLGKTELAIGPDALKRLADSTHIPLLSANTRLADNTALAPNIRIFQFHGKRLGVIGLVSPRFATPAILVGDPRQAIVDTALAHRGDYDSLLVLAYLPDDELQQLAAQTPEADVIVGGPTGQSIVPRRVGPVLLASATNKGKFVIQLEPPPADGSPWQGKVVELGPTYPDDDAQQANLQTYLDQLKDRDFAAADSGFAPVLPAGAPADYRVAGSSSCLSCHAEAANVWVHSLHAHAVDALRPRHFEVDPDCLQCHTTEYGLPGGFVSPRQTPELDGVGCENCHGPSQAHVNNPKVRTPYSAFDTCIRCHDEENSPKFNREQYWKKVSHGPTTRPVHEGAAG